MFKQLFGQPSRKHITIAFLNDLLGRTGADTITDLSFENTEYMKGRKDGKTVRLDVAVRTSVGERINVEIQLVDQQDMPERTLYYWARMFSWSIASGDPYTSLPSTIVISIINYPLFPEETDRFHTIFHIREDEEQFLWTNLLEFHALDLSAFMVQWRKYRRKLKEEKIKELPWLMMLSAVDYRKKKTNNEMLAELEEWAVNIEEVRAALIEWETISANKENRVVYEARMKELRDLLSNLQGYQRKGIEEGIKIGVEKGVKEGIEMVAKKMLQDGMSLSKIAEITGLSEELIRELR